MNANATQDTPLSGKRILIAKPGLDGHDIGAKVIALSLRDAGAEVIYTGLRKTPAQIASVAIDEGVDAVGLSILSGSHMALVDQVLQALADEQAEDIRIFVGGTIPAEDRETLLGRGVSGVFTSDMPVAEVIESLASALS